MGENLNINYEHKFEGKKRKNHYFIKKLLKVLHVCLFSVDVNILS